MLFTFVFFVYTVLPGQLLYLASYLEPQITLRSNNSPTSSCNTPTVGEVDFWIF
jgi:hypothetical protein